MNEVVVVLPYSGNKVLMQLRDFKSGIVFPGQWGFFGGSVEKGEDLTETARRELFEEIGYQPQVLYRLDSECLPGLDNVVCHSFFCPLTVPVKDLDLKEGLDLGFFSLTEIEQGQLYSQKLKKIFSVIPSGYVRGTIKKVLNRVKKEGLSG